MAYSYLERPDQSFLNSLYGCVNLLGYPEYLRYYNLAAKPQDNDQQHIEITDDPLENNYYNKIYPSVIPMMTGNGQLKFRKFASF